MPKIKNFHLAVLFSIFPLLTSLGCADWSSKPGHFPLQEVEVPAASVENGIGYLTVQEVFQKRCTECHNQNHQFHMSYDEAFQAAMGGGASQMYRRVVVQQSMPPASSAQGQGITVEERELIGQWVLAGAPREAQATMGAPALPAGVILSEEDVIVGPPALFLESCISCHGNMGRAAPGSGTPHLQGQDPYYLREQLKAFRSWERLGSEESEMNERAAELSDEQISFAASYFAAAGDLVDRPVLSREVDVSLQVIEDPGLAARANTCLTCHAQEIPGIGAPKIIGQDQDYLFSELKSYRDGTRVNVRMNAIVQPLSDEDLKALARYFAGAQDQQALTQ